MPQRLKLIVAYDGAAFAGWQSQSHRNTVQDNLERAFRKITGKITRVHGAGRTDAGVHALAQCAHVDLADRRLSTARWTAALNSLLPPTIRILRCRYVAQDFHARFSAKGKVYRYRIWSGPILPPLELARAWHIPAKLDFDVLKAAAAQFVGTHDFAAFAANRGKSETSTTRTIRSIVVGRKGPGLTIEFDGNGFLYKMVRLMVGSMSQAALGKLTVDDIAARLLSGRANGARLTVPADGLFLVRVWY
jgi:tRNA pseudouridine38-40 synthase